MSGTNSRSKNTEPDPFTLMPTGKAMLKLSASVGVVGPVVVTSGNAKTDVSPDSRLSHRWRNAYDGEQDYRDESLRSSCEHD